MKEKPEALSDWDWVIVFEAYREEARGVAAGLGKLNSEARERAVRMIRNASEQASLGTRLFQQSALENGRPPQGSAGATFYRDASEILISVKNRLIQLGKDGDRHGAGF
jgi:hypothetical protein